MLTKFQDSNQWKWIFIIAAILYCTGSVTFWFMSSGKVQDWAEAKSDEESTFKTQSIDTLELDLDEKKNQINGK